MPPRGSGFVRSQTERGVAAHENVFEVATPLAMTVAVGPFWCQPGGSAPNHAPHTTAARLAGPITVVIGRRRERGPCARRCRSRGPSGESDGAPAGAVPGARPAAVAVQPT